MAQGIEFNQEEVIESLRPYFMLGYNRRRACMFGGIDNSTLSRWEKDNPTLSTKIDAWINSVNAKARENIARKISAGDVSESKWWIEKTDKDFTEKTETEVTGGLTIKIVEDIHAE